MNQPNQTLPLLKQMLGCYRFGPWPLLIYLCACTAVLLVSAPVWPASWLEAHGDAAHGSGLMVGNCVAWGFFLAMVATPAPFQALGGVMSLEFLFTRPIDRARWLRTERLAVIIIGAGPLILNLLLSPLGPKITFEEVPPGSPATALVDHYQQLFPGSEWVPGHTAGGAQELVVRHGTEMFALWLLWMGVVIIFLVAAYYSWVFTAWQRAGWHHSKSRLRPWLGAAMIHGPLLGPLVLLVILGPMRINVFESSFLFFTAHPAAMVLALVALIAGVQWMSERNIRKLEFEFA